MVINEVTVVTNSPNNKIKRRCVYNNGISSQEVV